MAYIPKLAKITLLQSCRINNWVSELLVTARNPLAVDRKQAVSKIDLRGTRGSLSTKQRGQCGARDMEVKRSCPGAVVPGYNYEDVAKAAHCSFVNF